MGKAKDLTGQRFGRLTVTGFYGRDSKGRRQWKCKCDCGTEKVVLANKLLTGRIKSCGCIRKELSKERMTRHGMYGTRLYNIWADMIQRCNNPKNISYKYYGGKGVTVCEEWKDFPIFAKWALANGYNDNLSIDRKNSNGNYEPGNCRWETNFVQCNNKGNNRRIAYNGRTYTAAEIAKETGDNYFTIISRIKRGWSDKEVYEGRKKYDTSNNEGVPCKDSEGHRN